MNDFETRKKDIDRALSEVVDPETGLSVIRMELIDHVKIDDAGNVSLVFRPSSPVCPMAYTLANRIKGKIKDLDWVNKVSIKVENYTRSEHLETLLTH